MNTDHGSYVRTPPRSPNAEEVNWIREIVLSNPDWADVDLNNLRVIAECSCGCRSVVFEEPDQPQNPRFVGHQGLVGEMSLRIRVKNKEDVVSVLLHFAEGSLSLLEVIWYNFPEPVPSAWTEISRLVSSPPRSPIKQHPWELGSSTISTSKGETEPRTQVSRSGGRGRLKIGDAGKGGTLFRDLNLHNSCPAFRKFHCGFRESRRLS
jgi:hypothetical protein